jgi:Ion channel
MVSALLVGLGMLFVGMLSYGVAATFMAQLVVHLVQKGNAGLAFWKNVAVMTIVSLVTALLHLMQIGLWALTILMCGEASTFANAFYFSAQNYTALGYGDVILSERWRLLGPLEAINGLLLFGLSTAVMFAVMSRLITTRLHLHKMDG